MYRVSHGISCQSKISVKGNNFRLNALPIDYINITSQNSMHKQIRKVKIPVLDGKLLLNFPPVLMTKMNKLILNIYRLKSQINIL